MTPLPHGLERAREEIAAARLLADAGFAAAAVSRAYYAAFYAAEATLLLLGETRSKHSGVVSALGQVAIKRHGLEPDAGRLLRSLFDRRSQADYGVTEVPAREAQAALVDAELVLAAVDAWLVDRSTTGTAP